MRILGIDPGKTLGWGFIAPLGSDKPFLLEYGTIHCRGSNGFDCMNNLFTDVDLLIKKLQPDLVAVEKVIAGVNTIDQHSCNFWPVGSFVVTGQVAEKHNIPVASLGNSTMRATVIGPGHGRTKAKGPVVKAVNAFFGTKFKCKENHITDAIAIALTAWLKGVS